MGCVCVIKNSKDEILLLKRKPEDRTLPNVYCLPGGKKENGESFHECIIREVKEETNLDIIPNTLGLLLISHGIFFYSGLVSNLEELKISEEHESYLFIRDFYSIDIAKVTNIILRNYFSGVFLTLLLTFKTT